MEYVFQYAGDTHRVHIDVKGETYSIDLESGPVEVDARPISDNCLSLILGNRSLIVYLAHTERETFLHIRGHHFRLEKADGVVSAEAGRTEQGGPGDLLVAAPMPGTVVAVQVKVGDVVEKNRSLVIVESMKMENALRSPIDGRVEKINYAEGDLVDAGVPIVELVPEEESG